MSTSKERSNSSQAIFPYIALTLISLCIWAIVLMSVNNPILSQTRAPSTPGSVEFGTIASVRTKSKSPESTDQHILGAQTVKSSKAGLLAIYSEPDDSSFVIYYAYPDQEFPVRSGGNGWYEIVLPTGGTGWIPAYMIEVVTFSQ